MPRFVLRSRIHAALKRVLYDKLRHLLSDGGWESAIVAFVQFLD